MVSVLGASALWLGKGREKFNIGTIKISEISAEIMQKIINTFGTEKILFGSDWPWMEQKKSIDYIRSLPISDEQKSDILGGNALKFFQK